MSESLSRAFTGLRQTSVGDRGESVGVDSRGTTVTWLAELGWAVWQRFDPRARQHRLAPVIWTAFDFHRSSDVFNFDLQKWKGTMCSVDSLLVKQTDLGENNDRDRLSEVSIGSNLECDKTNKEK